MKTTKFISTIGSSMIALSLATMPALAQQDNGSEQGTSDEAKAAIAIGTVVAAGAAMNTAGNIGTSAKTAKAPVKRANSLEELKRRGKIAKERRQALKKGSANTARPAKLSNTKLGKALQKGEAAQNSRAAFKKAAAKGARPGNVANSQLGKLLQKGEAAKNSRAAIKNTARNAGRPTNLVKSNLGKAIQKGEAAQSSRAAIRNNVNKGPVRQGNGLKATFRDQVKPKKSLKGADNFARNLTNPKGANANVAKLVKNGDAAQLARGKIVNEGQLLRQIDKGGDITKLNKAGRGAQQARNVSNLKAYSKTTKTAKAAKGASVSAKTAKAAKAAKTLKTAAAVGKGGKAARAALAGTGVGAVVVAAEIVGTESIKALTGAEVQDPLTTSFQYGSAIFDKDVSLKDVMAQRREHHRKNFQKIGETFTEPGKLKENLSVYGQKKAQQFKKAANFVDEKDRATRSLIKNTTGIQLDRRSDVMKRYGAAMAGDNKAGALLGVAADRTKHHLGNVKAVGALAGKAGEAGRNAIGNATGADLRSGKETLGKYGAALKGDNKIKAVGNVAVQRAKHHGNNVKKVSKKFGCGVGNVFKKKKNKKKC